MLKLSGQGLQFVTRQGVQRQPEASPRQTGAIQVPSSGPLASGPLRELLRIYTAEVPSRQLRAEGAWLVTANVAVPEGFAGYLVPQSLQHRHGELPTGCAMMVLTDDFDYLSHGDVVRVNWERGSIGVLYRRASRYNTLLVTEQCNHYCLMCSQPPKRPEDRWLVEDAQRLVRMLPRETESLGISGGEPTLLGNDLLELLRLMRAHLPQTRVDLLSNGRRFAEPEFVRSYAEVSHPNLTVGIPLYSDDPSHHDHIVQARGAFDETVRGILNLKRLNQSVEVRVVLHALSVTRLTELARYLTRNLLFVDHVALMGLEMTGFTLANLDSLWIDPYDYREELAEAVFILECAGMHVSVYNLPLCIAPVGIERAYRKSISDWKNEYLPQCGDCTRREDCGGFFSSSLRTRTSSHIIPFD